MKVRIYLLAVIAVLLLSAGLLSACTTAEQQAPAVNESVISTESVSPAEPEIIETETDEPLPTPTAAIEEPVKPEPDVQEDGEDMAVLPFLLTSPAFESGAGIPVQYTCSGEDRSPQLVWSGVPAETRGFALVCNDPDAPVGNWIHWVIYNMPADLSELPENVAKTEMVAGIGVQGKNDSRKTGYNGPCPPPGSPHRYYFTLYALDEETQFQSGLTADQLYEAIDEHVLAEAQWMGTFQR